MLFNYPAALPFGLAHFTPVNRSKILLYKTCNICYTYYIAYRKGDKQLCAKVKLAEIIKRNIDKKGDKNVKNNKTK